MRAGFANFRTIVCRRPWTTSLRRPGRNTRQWVTREDLNFGVRLFFFFFMLHPRTRATAVELLRMCRRRGGSHSFRVRVRRAERARVRPRHRIKYVYTIVAVYDILLLCDPGRVNRRRSQDFSPGRADRFLLRSTLTTLFHKNLTC